MTTPKDWLRYAEWLESITRGNTPRSPRNGLCFNFRNDFKLHLSCACAEAGIDWEDWEEYSGNPYYPVPSTDPGKPARDLYWDPPKTDDNFYQGIYGESRKRLAGFLAEGFRKAAEKGGQL